MVMSFMAVPPVSRASGRRRSQLDRIAGPEREPSTNHDHEQDDPDDRRMITYGIIRAMMVPMPASFW